MDLNDTLRQVRGPPVYFTLFLILAIQKSPDAAVHIDM